MPGSLAGDWPPHSEGEPAPAPPSANGRVPHPADEAAAGEQPLSPVGERYPGRLRTPGPVPPQQQQQQQQPTRILRRPGDAQVAASMDATVRQVQQMRMEEGPAPEAPAQQQQQQQAPVQVQMLQRPAQPPPLAATIALPSQDALMSHLASPDRQPQLGGPVLAQALAQAMLPGSGGAPQHALPPAALQQPGLMQTQQQQLAAAVAAAAYRQQQHAQGYTGAGTPAFGTLPGAVATLGSVPAAPMPPAALHAAQGAGPLLQLPPAVVVYQDHPGLSLPSAIDGSVEASDVPEPPPLSAAAYRPPLSAAEQHAYMQRKAAERRALAHAAAGSSATATAGTVGWPSQQQGPGVTGM